MNLGAFAKGLDDGLKNGKSMAEKKKARENKAKKDEEMIGSRTPKKDGTGTGQRRGQGSMRGTSGVNTKKVGGGTGTGNGSMSGNNPQGRRQGSGRTSGGW